MNQLLFYLLQVLAASGLLYGYYHFALRNKKFHRYNRFYLLMAVVISTLIPFFNIPVYFSEKEAGSSVMLQTLQVISSPSLSSENPVVSTAIQTESVPGLTTENVIYFFYFFILAFFLLRVFISLGKIKTIIKRNQVERIDKIKFINTDEPGTPFSFFRWLFWNRKIELKSEKGEQIFRHELFHIQQRHSWDIIFMEILSTIFWINPFFHLIKKELKAIHEFLADEFAIKEDKNWQYAELLLMQVLGTNNQLVNPFFHNQIKRRIAMITTSTKPSYRYLRKLMVLPVAAIIIFLFAFNYKNKLNNSNEFEKAVNTITVVIDAGHGGADAGAKSPDGKYTEAQLTLEIAKTIQRLAPDFNVNLVMTRDDEALPGGLVTKTDALKKRIEIAKQYHPDAFISIHTAVEGVYDKYQEKSSGFVAYITDHKPDEKNILFAKTVLNELKPVFKTDSGVRQRVGAGLNVLDKNAFPSMLLECGYINNKKDISFFTDKNNQEEVARAILKGLVNFANNQSTDDKSEGDDKTEMVIDSSYFLDDDLKNALIVIDGVIQEKRGIEGLKSQLLYKKGSTAIFNILKDRQAIDKYGEKGKDGVIEVVTTKKKEVIDTIPKVDTIYWLKDMPPPAKKSPTAAELKSWEDAKMHGVWIDGKRINNSELKKFSPSDFVLFYDSKLAKNAVNYGKHYYQINLYTAKEYDRLYGPDAKRTPILVREVTLDSTIKPQPLIVLNGKPLLGLEFSALDKMIAPDKIESITVLKDKTATDKYGDKAKYGVIEVKSKEFIVRLKDETIKEVRVDGKLVQEDDNKVFVKVEVESAFPGGHKEWTNFLTRNLDPNVPVKNGAKPGTYTVVVQFIVDKNGTVTNVTALTNHGFGMEEEAMRIIKKGPNWIPAIQNGRIVKAYRQQPVTFVITAQ